MCQWVKRVDYGHASARRDEAVDDVRADEAGAARHENVFGSAHQPVATMLWIRMAQPACAASSPRRAPALRIAAVASMSHGRNGSQMRSTSAFDRPLTSATNPHPRPTPSRARAPRLSPALQRAQTAPGLASHAPDGANQRRSKRLRAYAGAIFSAGSSTNTKPPEFANPTVDLDWFHELKAFPPTMRTTTSPSEVQRVDPWPVGAAVLCVTGGEGCRRSRGFASRSGLLDELERGDQLDIARQHLAAVRELHLPAQAEVGAVDDGLER